MCVKRRKPRLPFHDQFDYNNVVTHDHLRVLWSQSNHLKASVMVTR